MAATYERHQIQSLLEAALETVEGVRVSPFVAQRWGQDPGGSNATGLVAVEVGPTRPATGPDRQRRDVGVYVACAVRVRLATGLREKTQAADLTAARELLATVRKALMAVGTLPLAAVRHDSEGEELSPNGTQVWSTLELTVAYTLPLS
jgi:hypothetical protein